MGLLRTRFDAAPAIILLALASLTTHRRRCCSALVPALFRRGNDGRRAAASSASTTPIRTVLLRISSPTDAAARGRSLFASPRPPLVVRRRFSSSSGGGGVCGGSARVGMSASDDDAEGGGVAGASSSDGGDPSGTTTAAAGGGRKSTAAARTELIDVDCNLLHPDLASLLTPEGGPSSSSSSSRPSPDEPPPPAARRRHPSLEILRHPSTSNAGIAAVLSPSSTLDESERGLSIFSSLSSTTPSEEDGANGIEVLTTAGVHPYNVDDLPPSEDNVERLNSLLAEWGAGEEEAGRSSEERRGDGGEGEGGGGTRRRKGPIAAVGECGLDYSPGFPPRENQLPWFRVQLRAALEYDLPVFLHERLAFEETLELIDEALEERDEDGATGGRGDLRVIVHCFTGTRSEASVYLERGYSISLSGYLLKDNADNCDEIRDLLREGAVPLDKLMIETDAPYLGFPSCRESFFADSPDFANLNGKKRKKLLKGVYPNVPSALPKVLDAVVKYINEGREARGEALMSREEVAAATVRNSCSFFGFSARN